jgi:hypothetical protein
LLYPRLLAWHRYLASARDPEGSGLLTIYHPWESGTDNSPRWDAPLAAVAVGPLEPYARHDLKVVADPAERPSQAEYDRYLWLVESLKECRYDDAAIRARHPFLVQDVLFSAIFAAASAALAQLAARLGAPEAERQEIHDCVQRTSNALLEAGDGLALDRDLRQAGRPIEVETCAGLAPLLLPDLPLSQAKHFARRLFSNSFAGAPGLAYPAVPSTAPGSPDFRPRAYWRGPVWPVINWLFWRALVQHGLAEQAAALRAANLALLARPDAGCAEYYEPYTAEPLGSTDQSWTAAVWLDWLRAGEPPW